MTDSTDEHGNRILFLRFPLTTRAIVTPNEDGSFTIAINSSLSYEAQRAEYAHELGHILKGHFDYLNLNQAEKEVEE